MEIAVVLDQWESDRDRLAKVLGAAGEEIAGPNVAVAVELCAWQIFKPPVTASAASDATG